MGVSGRYLAAAAFLIYLLVGVVIHSDYAVSWDEPTSRMNGLVSLKYVDRVLGSGGLQEELSSIPDLAVWQDRDYGVAFELPLAAAEQLTGVAEEEIWPLRHLLTFLLSALGVFAVYRTAKLAYANEVVAIMAAIFMAISPRMFAESFYNSKDIAFMAAMAISTWTLTRLLISGRLEAVLFHGLATAFAVDIRVMGVVLLPLTILLLIIQVMRGKRAGLEILRLILLYTCTTLAAVYVMFPFLWEAPVRNFMFVFERMAHFRWENEVLYLGRVYKSAELPWHYLFVWIAITTPPSIIFLAIMGTLSALAQVVQRRGKFELTISYLLLAYAPVVAVIVMGSVVYDGWRQLYFIYPSLILLSAGALVSIGNWAIRSPISARFLLVALAASLAMQIGWIVKAHPLQNVYFNFLAGSDWKRRFEVDYWGLANSSAIKSVVDRQGGRTISIKAVSRTPLDRALLDMPSEYREHVVIVDDRSKPEFILNNYRGVSGCVNLCIPSEYEEYWRKEVAGEDIVSISRLRPGVIADPYFRGIPFSGRFSPDIASKVELLITGYSPIAGGINASVRIRNGSGSAMKTIEADGHNVRLSWRLVPDGGTSILPGWDARKDLSLELLPGEAVDLAFNVNAPPGRYVLEVSLVQEMVFWFHDQGMKVPTKAVVI